MLNPAKNMIQTCKMVEEACFHFLKPFSIYKSSYFEDLTSMELNEITFHAN